MHVHTLQVIVCVPFQVSYIETTNLRHRTAYLSHSISRHIQLDQGGCWADNSVFVGDDWNASRGIVEDMQRSNKEPAVVTVNGKCWEVESNSE